MINKVKLQTKPDFTMNAITTTTTIKNKMIKILYECILWIMPYYTWLWSIVMGKRMISAKMYTHKCVHEFILEW